MKIPLHKILDPEIIPSGINLHVLRLDLNHPYMSGNKWYKLKYNIEELKRYSGKTSSGKSVVLTFGGAFSNHIAAVAAAGKEFGFKTIGIIRGIPPPFGNKQERTAPIPSTEKYKRSYTLEFAEKCGMQLHFISREEYRKKDSADFIHSLTRQFGNFYLLPEGGTNELAIKGCSEILSAVDIPFNYICCPVGTGGTLAGIISSLDDKQKAIGFSVLNAKNYHTDEINKWLLNFRTGPLSPKKATQNNFQIEEGYHFGGYAKHTPELLRFIADFEKQTQIRLDHVYTGKMIFGIYDLIRKDYFPENSTIIAVHTGGLQGKLKIPVLKEGN